MIAGFGCNKPLHTARTWGQRGCSAPPRMARAFTVNRTVALAFPSGCAEMMASDVTVMWGPPIIDRKQVRCAGSTVRAAACASLRPSASQNARTTSVAAAAWAGDSVPEARGGLADTADAGSD